MWMQVKKNCAEAARQDEEGGHQRRSNQCLKWRITGLGRQVAAGCSSRRLCCGLTQSLKKQNRKTCDLPAFALSPFILTSPVIPIVHVHSRECSRVCTALQHGTKVLKVGYFEGLLPCQSLLNAPSLRLNYQVANTMDLHGHCPETSRTIPIICINKKNSKKCYFEQNAARASENFSPFSSIGSRKKN